MLVLMNLVVGILQAIQLAIATAAVLALVPPFVRCILAVYIDWHRTYLGVM